MRHPGRVYTGRAEGVAALLAPELRPLAQEQLRVLLLDTKNNVIAHMEACAVKAASRQLTVCTALIYIDPYLPTKGPVVGCKAGLAYAIKRNSLGFCR